MDSRTLRGTGVVAGIAYAPAAWTRPAPVPPQVSGTVAEEARPDEVARFKAAVAKIPNVSSEMPPEVNLLDIRLEGPQIAVRPYTHTDHYWQVYFDTNEAIVRVCQEAGWPAPSALHQFKQLS